MLYVPKSKVSGRRAEVARKLKHNARFTQNNSKSELTELVELDARIYEIFCADRDETEPHSYIPTSDQSTGTMPPKKFIVSYISSRNVLDVPILSEHWLRSLNPDERQC